MRVQSEQGGSDNGGEDGSHGSRIDGGIVKVLEVILATVIIITFISGGSHHTARMKHIPTMCSAVPDDHGNLIVVLESLVFERFYMFLKLENN